MKIKKTALALIAILPIILKCTGVSFCAGEGVGNCLAGAIDNEPMVRSDTFFVKRGQTLHLMLVSQQEMQDYDRFDKSEYSVVWYQISPVLKPYSNLWLANNSDDGNIHLEPVEYDKKYIQTVTGRSTICVTDIIGDKGFGTYYFSAELRCKNDLPDKKPERFSTAGLIHKKYPHPIVQIVYRPDDSYLGYLCELMNTPFVIAPMFSTNGLHQTDYRCGSDCAAFAIYGKRR